MTRTVRIVALATAALGVVALATPSQAASTTGALMITHVRPNAAGADTSGTTQLNLNGEYFVIKNVTSRTVNTSGYVPDITTNSYGRALPTYYLPAGAKAYVHTGSGRHYRDSSGAHHIYRGYARHTLLNTSTVKNPDLRLKKPGSPDNNTSTGSISTCNWNTAANGTTYSC
ncbi:hypothetical protein ACFY8P_26815 [Streptomyces sp. NPDC012693]|uniref:hypothetical protein n=1 Tax=unclassified Streptomyces TaxID=2593676 RepID=UPI0033DCEDCF